MPGPVPPIPEFLRRRHDPPPEAPLRRRIPKRLVRARRRGRRKALRFTEHEYGVVDYRQTLDERLMNFRGRRRSDYIRRVHLGLERRGWRMPERALPGTWDDINSLGYHLEHRRDG